MIMEKQNFPSLQPAKPAFMDEDDGQVRYMRLFRNSRFFNVLGTINISIYANFSNFVTLPPLIDAILGIKVVLYDRVMTLFTRPSLPPPGVK